MSNDYIGSAVPDISSAGNLLGDAAKASLRLAISSMLLLMTAGASTARGSSSPSSHRRIQSHRKVADGSGHPHPDVCTVGFCTWGSSSGPGSSNPGTSAYPSNFPSHGTCDDDGCHITATVPAQTGVVTVPPPEIEPIELPPPAIGVQGSALHRPTAAQKKEAEDCAKKYGQYPGNPSKYGDPVFTTVFAWTLKDAQGNVIGTFYSTDPGATPPTSGYLPTGALTGPWPGGAYQSRFYEGCYSSMGQLINCLAHEDAHQSGVPDLQGEPNGAYAVGAAAQAAAANDPDCQ